MALVTDSVHVSPAEAEKEFRRRNEQVKAEYVLVTADNAGLTATDDEVARALRGEQGRLQASRAARALVRPGRRRRRWPRGSPSPTATCARYYEAHRDEFQQAGGAVRQPHPGQGEGDAGREGRALRRRGAPDRAVRAGRRSGWARDFAAVAQAGLGGRGLGRAGRRPRLLPARPHGAGVRQRGLCPRRRARSRTW